MLPPYPVAWPDGVDRTEATARRAGAFKVDAATAINGLTKELSLFGAKEIVITSNVAGIMPDRNIDPAVAVWFTWKGMNRCFACDRYLSIAANLRAISLSVNALRAIDRHDATFLAQLMKATTSKALPNKGTRAEWYDILGVDRAATKADIKAAFQLKAKTAHPDAGGTAEKFHQLTTARDKGLLEASQ